MFKVCLQRFEGQETDSYVDLPEVVGPEGVPVVLDGRPEPDVVGNGSAVEMLEGSLGALSENLKGVCRCFGHHVEHSIYELGRDFGVKEITHGVHEHDAGLAPVEQVLDLVRVECDCESVFVSLVAHGLQPDGEAFGVTVVAAR